MDAETLFTLGTVINRSLMIATGALSIWLGYRLFARAHPASSAEISVKDHLKINLLQVGPGTFFCLAGTAVLLYHLHMPAMFALNAGPAAVHPPAPSPVASPHVVVYGADADARDPLAAERERVRAQQHIEFLNQLAQAARRHDVVTDPAVPDFEVRVRELKLDLMQTTWRAQWGDRAEFSQLVRTDAPEMGERYRQANEAFARGAR